MGVKQTLTEYTIDDVRNLSEILSRYANRYDELAKKMAQNSFKSLDVPNQKSMEDGLEKLRRHIAEAEISFNEQLDMSTGVLSAKKRVAEMPEPYITPVGKNKPPIVRPKPDSSTNKKAQ
jgi:hypothetical protein